jgi:hypothetical protein
LVSAIEVLQRANRQIIGEIAATIWTTPTLTMSAPSSPILIGPSAKDRVMTRG